MQMFTIGFSTNEYLLLDLDAGSRYRAVKLAMKLLKLYPELGNALVRRSSKSTDGDILIHDTSLWMVKLVRKREGWHIIFGGRVSFSRILKITELLEELGVISKEHLEIRRKRGDSTLRLTDNKPYDLHDSSMDDDAIMIIASSEKGDYEGIDMYMLASYAVRKKCLNLAYIFTFNSLYRDSSLLRLF